jgi:MFS family permease
MPVSLFWIGFPYLVMGFTHDYWMMLLCATFVGIGNNLWHPTAIPWLADRFPDRKGLVVSFHSMGGNVGDAFAPLVVGALLAVFSWREVVLMNVVPGVAVAALILFYIGRIHNAEKAAGTLSKPAPKSGGEHLRAFLKLLTDRALVTLSISSMFRTMTQSALLTFLPVYLARDMGYSPLWIGACMFVLQAAGFIAAPIAGHLSDTVGRRQIVTSTMAMSAVVLAAMTFAGGTIWFVMLVSALGFFLFAVRAVMQAWAMDSAPPGMGGSAIGLLFCAQALGAAVGPIAAGVLADQYGIMAAFYFLAGTIVVANVMVLVTPTGPKDQTAAA